MSVRFRVNSPPVVLETVDEETIIVNLDSGNYYDLNHSGGRVLGALADGADVDTAIDALAAAYEVRRDEVEAPVRTLVEALGAEGIIGESENGGGNGNGAGLVAAEPATRPYEHPALGKYTDMQELLLLDPIHEVDGTGWPHKA
jgi:hypothetical protein